MFLKCSLLKIVVILSFLCWFGNARDYVGDKQLIDSKKVVQELQNVVIPRFQKHIKTIRLKQPALKHHLTIKVTKLSKARTKTQKRVEEIKLEAQKKKNEKELRSLSKAPKNVQMNTKSAFDKINSKCTKTAAVLHKMQTTQKRLVKVVDRITAALRAKKIALRKADSILKMRIARNTKKINEIKQLIKDHQVAVTTSEIMKKQVKQKEANNQMDEEYHILKRNLNKVLLKKHNTVSQLNDMLKAMTVRAEVKNQFKEAKSIIKDRLKDVKVQMKRDKAILRRASLKRRVLKRKSQKNQSKSVNTKQINNEIRRLRNHIHENSVMLRKLKHKLTRATSAYEAKKKTIEGKISRQKLYALKTERRKLLSDLRKNSKRYTHIERKILMNEDPDRTNEMKNKLSALKNERVDLKKKLAFVKGQIATFFIQRSKRIAEKQHRIAVKQSILKRRVIVLRRIRTLNEKKLSVEKNKRKRHSLLHTIKSLGKRIRFVRLRIRRLTRISRNMTVRNFKRANNKYNQCQRRYSKLQKRLARLQLRKEKYLVSEHFKPLVPQVDRKIKEISLKIKGSQEELRHSEAEANKLDAEVREIKKLRAEEAKVKKTLIKKRLHITESKLQALKGKKGQKAHDVTRMLKMKVRRLKRREKRNELITTKHKRKVGIHRFHMILKGGFKRIKAVVNLQGDLHQLEKKLRKIEMLEREMSTVNINGEEKEKLEVKREELQTARRLIVVQIQKKYFSLQKATASLFRTTAIIRGVAEATIQAHRVTHAKMLIERGKLQQELEQESGDEITSKTQRLEDLNEDLKKSAVSIHDLQVQVTKFVELTFRVTRFVNEKLEKKEHCALCLNLAKNTIEKYGLDGVSRIKSMKDMDSYCRQSLHPTECYRTMLLLESKIYEEKATPQSVCNSIGKC
ncbi:DNA repair protein Rad-50 [Entamoeba marina]